MDWHECLRQRIAKAVPADERLAHDLIRQARNRRLSAERLELDEISAATLVTLWYDILRLHLEAAAARSGVKVYNHACYVGFARELLNDEVLATGFDTLTRNSVLYYAQDATVEQVLFERTTPEVSITELSYLDTIVSYSSYVHSGPSREGNSPTEHSNVSESSESGTSRVASIKYNSGSFAENMTNSRYPSG